MVKSSKMFTKWGLFRFLSGVSQLTVQMCVPGEASRGLVWSLGGLLMIWGSRAAGGIGAPNTVLLCSVPGGPWGTYGWVGGLHREVLGAFRNVRRAGSREFMVF